MSAASLVFGILKKLYLIAAAKHHFECVQLMLDAGCKLSACAREFILNGCRKFLPKTEREKIFPVELRLGPDEDGFFTTSLAYNSKRHAPRKIVIYIHSVKSLKATCKTFLRRECALFKPKDVQRLPLPNVMNNYILCKTDQFNIEIQ